MAEGFGADGVVVDNEQALEAALTAALASGRTTVIGAKIDGSGYVDQFNALREL
jgi:acetolactate synthase-1/2/3 large subunit